MTPDTLDFVMHTRPFFLMVYTPEEVEGFTKVVQKRIAELNAL